MYIMSTVASSHSSYRHKLKYPGDIPEFKKFFILSHCPHPFPHASSTICYPLSYPNQAKNLVGSAKLQTFNLSYILSFQKSLEKQTYLVL